jgi:hypothetical protein
MISVLFTNFQYIKKSRSVYRVMKVRCRLSIVLKQSICDMLQIDVYLYLYYYIKHLRIGGSIFCHGNFLLYPFYPSIRRLIFIFGWSNVCDRVHWSTLSFHFFPLNTIISIILFFYLETLCIFDKKLMVIIYVRIIYFSCHKNHESLTHCAKISSKIKYSLYYRFSL